jgi:hypothetical protein
MGLIRLGTHFLAGAGIFGMGAAVVVIAMSLNVVAGGLGPQVIHESPPPTPAVPTPGAVLAAAPPSPAENAEPCKGEPTPAADRFEIVGQLVQDDPGWLVVDVDGAPVGLVTVENMEVRSDVQAGDDVFVQGSREGGVLIATTIGKAENRCATPTPTPSPTKRPTRVPTPTRPPQVSPTPEHKNDATPRSTIRPTFSPTAPTANGPAGGPPPSDGDRPTPRDTSGGLTWLPSVLRCVVSFVFDVGDDAC